MIFREEANIWPLMSKDELQALAEDIDKNGQRDPISIYKGEVLDGRNRYVAITTYCKSGTSIKSETVSPHSPIAFVISRNEKRRHLSLDQRAMAAAKSLPFFEDEALKRMSEGGGKSSPGKPRKGSPIGDPLLPQKRLASDDAAKAFNTTPRSVQRAKYIQASGSQKLQDAINTKNLSLGKAEQIVKQSADKKEQNRKLVVIQKSKMVNRTKGLTGEIEWYTPREYLDSAVEVMGSIDLDPASSKTAQKHVKAKKFYTIQKDGLLETWEGCVFLNPPYAMPAIKQFTERIVKAYVDKEIAQGILLTNNATDTTWFHVALLACNAFCFTRGRISFLEASNGELTEKKQPTHGQVFFYFGLRIKKFADEFSKYGTIAMVYEQKR